MVHSQSQLDDYLSKIPPPAEIKERLEKKLEETSVLRQLLRLSQQREKVKEGRSCK